MASTAAVDLVINLKDNASGPLGRIGSALGDLGARAGSAAGTLAKIGATAAVGGIVAVGGGIIAAATAGLRFNNTLEMTRAKMVAFTGSNEEAAKILEQVEARAAKTPFAFGEMADAAAAFLPLQKQTGIGWEKYAEQAEVLAALNPAEGLAGAAFALREAAGGDFLSIVERFNLPKKRLMELKAEGVPALEAVKTAMAEMGVDTSLVAGLAETASGRWSTFTDTLTSLAAAGTGKVFEQLSGSLGNVNAALVANAPQLEAFAVAIGERLGAALTWLIGQVPTVIAGFQSLFAAFQTIQGAVRGFTDTIATIFNPEYDPGWYASSWETAFYEIIQPAFQTVQGVIKGFVDAVATIFNPEYDPGWYASIWETALYELIIPAFQALQPVISQAVALFPQFQQAIQTLVTIALPLIQTMVDTWVERFNTLLGIVQSVWPSIQSIIQTAVTVIGTFLQTHGAEILTTLQGAWTTVQGAITTVVGVIGSIINTVFSVVASFLAGHSSEIQSVLTLAWETIQVVIEGATAIIEGVILPVFKGIATFLADHKAEITTILETAWSVIQVAIETTLNVIQGIVRTVMAVIKGDWQGAWDEIKGIVDTIWTGIQETAQIGVDTVRGIVASIGPKVQELAGDFLAKATALGQALIDGIVAGLSGLAEKAKEKIIGGISGGIEGVKSFFGISSPSRYMAREIGAPLAEGIVVGILSRNDFLQKAARVVVRDAFGAARGELARGHMGGGTQIGPEFVRGLLGDVDKTAQDAHTHGTRIGAQWTFGFLEGLDKPAGGSHIGPATVFGFLEDLEKKAALPARETGTRIGAEYTRGILDGLMKPTNRYRDAGLGVGEHLTDGIKDHIGREGGGISKKLDDFGLRSQTALERAAAAGHAVGSEYIAWVNKVIDQSVISGPRFDRSFGGGGSGGGMTNPGTGGGSGGGLRPGGSSSGGSGTVQNNTVHMYVTRPMEPADEFAWMEAKWAT